MKYKVLITTSGLGNRLGDITKYLNKALVRVGEKPAISYIIESYPKGTNFIITTGYLGYQIKDFIKITYPKLNVTYVEVNKYEGRGSSLGYSILQAKKTLQCPFIYHACDTIVNEKIPTPNTNWCGGFKGNNTANYASFTTQAGQIKEIEDKGSTNCDYLHIGLAGIYEYKKFWKTLNNLYIKDYKNKNLNDSLTVNSMINNGSDFKVKEFNSWFDIGNIDTLSKARLKIKDSFNNLDKIDESIYLFDDKVIKFYDNQNIIKDKVVRGKILKKLVPTIIASKKNFFCYKYIKGKVYSEDINPYNFKKFLNWSEKKLWIKINKYSKKSFYSSCKSFYFDKTLNRLNSFLQQNKLNDQTDIINGEKIPPIKDMLKLIDEKWLCDVEQYQFHGDYILDNIIQTEHSFLLIDWRQNFGGLINAGDIYYDLAKLNHSLLINHKIVGQELFIIDRKDKNVKCDILQSSNLLKSQEILWNYILQKKYDLNKVKILTAIIWINMSPLHHHPFNLFLYYFGKYNLYKSLQEK
ncbi:hypothetical protein HOD19_03255 [bacterium]|jgi:dTDP-glucose pyrophosphorylase|nr:hypothetical protein [bacterium]